LKDFVDEICNPKLQVHAGCCEKDGFDVVLWNNIINLAHILTLTWGFYHDQNSTKNLQMQPAI
jgi:hypothetical protein